MTTRPKETAENEPGTPATTNAVLLRGKTDIYDEIQEENVQD